MSDDGWRAPGRENGPRPEPGEPYAAAPAAHPPPQRGPYAAPGPDAAPTEPGPYGPPSGAGSYGPPSGAGSYGPPSGAGPNGPPSGAGPYGPPSGAGPNGPPSGAGPYGPPSGAGSYGPPSGAGAYVAPSRPGAYGPPSGAGTTSSNADAFATSDRHRDRVLGGPGYDSPAYRNDSTAVVSMVCGVIGILVPGVCLLAIAFGHLARRRLRTSYEGGRGLAVAGLAMGYAMTAVWLALFLLFLSVRTML